MLADANNDVEIADSAAAQPGIAFACDANALPIARSRLDANFERIGALHAAFAMADRTRRNILARPMASRTGDVELHPPARLLDRSLAMTLRTHARSLDEAIAVAVPANIAPGNIQLHHSAADRRPERHVDLILKIAARLRPFLGGLTAPAASKNIGEDISEIRRRCRSSRLASARARAFEQIGKIKAAEIDIALPAGLAAPPGKPPPKSPGPPRLSAATRVSIRRRRIDIVGVEPELVVDFPLLGIAENVVRLGKRLELFFRRSCRRD